MTGTSSLLLLLTLIPWAVLWLLGGFAIASAVFRLRPNEGILIGAAIGWLLENWLANLLSLALPMPFSFWLAAGLVFVTGAAAFLRAGRAAYAGWRVSVGQLLVFAVITMLFFNSARGLAVFDDFQHLPAASLIAAGDFPPHFALDPNVAFGYHHFLLLFSAQLMRLGGLPSWVAVDASRALSFGLAVMLSALFAQRLTRSRVAGFLGGAMIAFGSGTRWLLLLLPGFLVDRLSGVVQLIGSGEGSGRTLSEAMSNFWAVEGAGAVGYPFAFANGIFPAGVVLGHTANGLTGFVVIFLLLLTFNRWRSSLGAMLMAVFISIWGLLGEAELPAIAAGWFFIAAAWVIQKKSQDQDGVRLPGVLLLRSLWAWLGIAAAGCAIGVLEGGALTDLLWKTLARLSGQTAETSYQTVGFQLGLPAVVSSHLGVLPVLHPGALLVALLELGPVLLVFPLLVAYGIKAWRLRRWFEAATAASALFGLLMVFVQFAGSTGVRNTPRLYVFMPLLAAFAVPVVWMWASHRSARVKVAAAALGAAVVFGGLVMAGVSLTAAQRPVYSYFITALDSRMSRQYWNRLEPGALIFDPVQYRAPAIFGRHTDSNLTWYQVKPQWQALYDAPDPTSLRAAGFRYVYMDERYWKEIGPRHQEAFSDDCVLVIEDISGDLGSFRRLLDLQNCPAE